MHNLCMAPKSKRTPELEAELAAWIAGGKTLRDFCRQEGKPSYGAVYDWMEADKELASRIAHAREIGEEVIAQECLEIADDGSNDWIETKFGPQVNAEHIQRSKLRIETRLKLLAKWNPKKFGDKLAHTGADGSGPVELVVKHIGSDGENAG